MRRDDMSSSSKKWILIVIVLAIVLGFPTPREGVKTISYTDYETFIQTDAYTRLRCSRTLEDGHKINWDLHDTPDELVFDVDVSSTEEIVILIESVDEIEYRRDAKIHKTSFECNGPSIYVEIYNPTLLGTGPSAVISGDIVITYEHEVSRPVTKYRSVPITQWLPWWMP